MDKYRQIFEKFAFAPLNAFLDALLNSVSPKVLDMIVMEDVAYHSNRAGFASFDAWMCLKPIESNKWIWVHVEKDNASGAIKEQFFTKENYQRQSLLSLEECINFYTKKEK